MAVMLLMWLGRRVAARAISCLSIQIGQDPVLLLIPPLLATETIFGKNVDVTEIFRQASTFLSQKTGTRLPGKFKL